MALSKSHIQVNPFLYKKAIGWWYVDHRKLAILLIPTFLRKEPLISWLYTLVYPLVSLNYAFIRNRRDNIYLVEHTDQVCNLRKSLNDKFDIVHRRIYITNGYRFERKYIYTSGEQKPKYIYSSAERDETIYDPYYLRPATDYADTGVDAIVWVPTELQYNEAKIIAWIEIFKPMDGTYKIEYYE